MDPRLTGKVCSIINTMGLFELMTYREVRLLRKQHRSTETHDIRGAVIGEVRGRLKGANIQR